MPRFTTLTAALDANLRQDRHLILIDGEDKQRTVSFIDLKIAALAQLGALQRRGLQAGDAVILFVSDNEAFLTMFWGCVLGGIVPVPIAVGIGDEHRRKLFRVFAQFDRVWVYSEARTMERMDGFATSQGLGEVYAQLHARTLMIGGIDASGEPGVPVAAQPDDIAFIQYSSGSTSEPKGVVLTHRNLTANIASSGEAAAFCESDVALSWMPLSHDMGLIGMHLNLLFVGATHAIMRTDLFARRPLLWLSKATELKATVLCSPNFGYQHYLKQHELKSPQGLDLSSVRLIFNGAEPISAELCERFLRTMAAHGLRSNTMLTVYGLAEATVAVSFPRLGRPVEVVYLDRGSFRIGNPVRVVNPEHPQAASFVKLGRTVPGTQLRIGGESGENLADGVLGRVLIQGENVTSGYFRDAAATARAMTAEDWLDTGDLGLLIGGDLVIAGRAKDIIFVNGQNYYPHDLERIAEQVPGIETNKVVVVGASNPESGTEDLVVFALHKGAVEDFASLARELRRVLNQQTGLEVAHVIPVARIPKTTSGKLQRHLLVRAFEQGEFLAPMAALAALLGNGAAGTAPGTEPLIGNAARLMAICHQLIPDKQVRADTNLLEINLNSLTLARIHEAIDEAFPNRLEIVDLFDYPTLESLAAFLDAETS